MTTLKKNKNFPRGFKPYQKTKNYIIFTVLIFLSKKFTCLWEPRAKESFSKIISWRLIDMNIVSKNKKRRGMILINAWISSHWWHRSCPHGSTSKSCSPATVTLSRSVDHWVSSLNSAPKVCRKWSRTILSILKGLFQWKRSKGCCVVGLDEFLQAGNYLIVRHSQCLDV